MVGPSSSTLPETNSSHLKMDGWNTTFLLGRPIFRCELLVSGKVKWLENGVGVYQCHFQVAYIIIYIPIWESYYSHKMTFFTRYTWCPNTNSSVCCQALVENNRRLLTNSFRLWTINALGTQINQQQMIVLGDFGGNVGCSSHRRWFLSACSLRLAVLFMHLESRWCSSHA